MFSVLKKRQFAAAAFQTLQNASAPMVSMRCFAAPADNEAAKKAEEWGEKYSDECFAFEKEWETISKKIEDE
jgi:hypothetical protein